MIRDSETNREQGKAMWEGIFQTNCNQKPLAQYVELEDTWCSYAGFSLRAQKLCNGLGYHLQHLEKHARLKDTYAWLIVFYMVRNQDCILIIRKIISFPKILCKPNLRWHLGRKSRCQLTLIFSKISRDTLDFKSNVKWILSNIDTASVFQKKIKKKEREEDQSTLWPTSRPSFWNQRPRWCPS